MSYHRLFHVAEPSTPPAGTSRLYVGLDKIFKSKDDAGVIRQHSLPVGSNGDALVYNETTGLWESSQQSIAYFAKSEFLEDWGGNSTAGSFNWDTDTASSGSASSIQPFPISTDKRYGRIRYRISGTNASRAGSDRGAPELSIGASEVKVVTNNFFTTEFLNPANNCEFQTGLGSNGSDATTSFQTDGVYFRINSDGSVDGICSDGGVNTVSTGIVSILSERWYRFEIDINSTGTQATFKVYETYDNGTPPSLLASTTISSNLPPATANIGTYNILRHTAAGVAATNDVWQDYFYLRVLYSFER